MKKMSAGLSWYESTLLQEFPHIRHGSFTRHGGVSQGPFTSLNVGRQTGDQEEHVLRNRQLVIQTLAEDTLLPELISAQQTHSAIVEPIENLGAFQDGIMTNQPGKALLVQHADCQAALFYDPKQRVIGNVHSGWRGSVQNIYQNAIHAMQKFYGSKPENILVWISPSLGPEAAEFIHYSTELPASFWRFQTQPNYFDFWEISRSQLMDAGILAGHIETASLCTYSRPEDFFSYRREKVTGRLATVIWMMD